MTKLVSSLAVAALPVALALTLSLTKGATPVSAAFSEGGEVRITKDCSAYTGGAGSFCTIETSNVPQIKPGTRVYYDQAAGVPAGMLDSNVVLNVGTNDWAVGRCTLDNTSGIGLCTFSDGKGPLAGFTARVNVSFLGGTLYGWNGTYSFKSIGD